MSEIKYIIITICLLVYINTSMCSFMILPIKVKEENNPYIKPKTYITVDKFLQNYLAYTNYYEINVGTPSYTIPLEISTSITNLKSTYNYRFQNNKLNIFNASSSFKPTSEITLKQGTSYINANGNAIDIFHLSQTDTLNNYVYTYKDQTLGFTIEALIRDTDRYYTDIKQYNTTFSYIFGLGISDDYSNATNNVLRALKATNILDSYDFSFEYKQKDINNIGRLIFGKFDEIYNKEKYPDTETTYLRTAKLIPELNKFNYALKFDIIYIESITDNKTIGISVNEITKFDFNLNFILGTSKYLEEIEKLFFNKYVDVCKKDSGPFIHDGVIEMYTVFICDKEKTLNLKDKFPLLKFYHESLDYVFELKFDDLFIEIDNKLYFLICFNHKSANNFYFGNLFLKKYRLYFNVDSKTVKMYASNGKGEVPKKSSSNTLKVVLIILSIVIAFSLLIGGFLFGKKLYFKRKPRANELEDTYDYEYKTMYTKNDI